VGAFVGAAVGAAVGYLVGALEGVVVGNLVGWAVGSPAAVGVAVGVAVGLAVGAPVGYFVGAAVGLALGAKVGMPVGYAVNPYPYSERVTFEQTVAVPVIAAAAVCRAPRETVRLLVPPPAETYMTSSLTRMKSLVEMVVAATGRVVTPAAVAELTVVTTVYASVFPGGDCFVTVAASDAAAAVLPRAPRATVRVLPSTDVICMTSLPTRT